MISEAERESQFVENRENIFNGPTNEIDIELDVEEKFKTTSWLIQQRTNKSNTNAMHDYSFILVIFV